MLVEPENIAIEYWEQENNYQLASLYESINDKHLSDPMIRHLISDLEDWNPQGDIEEAKYLYDKNEYIISEIASHIAGDS